MAESGVRATCFGGFTIVYRHWSTEWPVPYTDSRTLAHEVTERVKESYVSGQKEKEKRKEKKKRKRKRIEIKTTLETTYGTIKAEVLLFHSLTYVHSYYT